MNHKGTKRIETERLILRRFTRGDIEKSYDNWMSDAEVTEFLTWKPHTDISVTEAVISDWISEYENDDYYQWAIELKEIGEPIGSISIVNKDEKTKMVHAGYCIGKRWWHQGITTEAFRAVIRFMFEEVGANRIESIHDPANPHSGDVMEKCGLQYEGILRESHVNNRGLVDSCMHALLKRDWRGR